ncbi:MAG: ATP-binding protein [Desulfovibrionaceae bacterium]
MKKVFIETNNVQQLRRAVQQAEDFEKGRPGMVAVWGEAGSGKTEAARMLYAEKGVYLRAMEGITQAAFLQDLCYEVKGSRPHGAHRCKMAIIEALDDTRTTIYLDEADRLDVRRIEDLRDIHDITGSPIVLIGEQGLPTKLEARSRIIDRIPEEFRIPFQKMDRSDVALFALDAASLNLSPEACVLVHREAKGNFRRVHNLLLSIEGAARAAGTESVGVDMVKAVIATHKRR